MKRREMFKALAVAPIAMTMLYTIPVPKQLIEWSMNANGHLQGYWATFTFYEQIDTIPLRIGEEFVIDHMNSKAWFKVTDIQKNNITAELISKRIYCNERKN